MRLRNQVSNDLTAMRVQQWTPTVARPQPQGDELRTWLCLFSCQSSARPAMTSVGGHTQTRAGHKWMPCRHNYPLHRNDLQDLSLSAGASAPLRPQTKGQAGA